MPLRAFAFAALLLCGACAFAADPRWNPGQPGESLSIALVTVGPGEIYWERFGHNAILVRDRESGATTLYNYGIFDFDQEDFFLNFLRGRMTYRIAAWPAAEDLPQYLREGREIVVQELNLSPPQRVALHEFLETNLRPENAQYRYDYFSNNCSTKVRDALDGALGGAIKRALEGRSRGYTYRMHALRLTAPDFWLYLGIHLGLGPYSDRPLPFWEELFVPMELARHVREVTVRDDAGNEVPLVAAEQKLAEARFAGPDELPPAWRWRYFGVGLGLAVVLVALSRSRRTLIARLAFALLASTTALVLGFGGLLLAGLWAFTEHRSAWANENLLLFDPLWLLLVPALVASVRNGWHAKTWHRNLVLALAVCCGFALFLKVFPAFAQDNLDWIALWLPVQLALGMALRSGAGDPAA
jgi:hypothetical protein